ncbi:hypothetical protein M1146_06475 [Patescibacteria group bacterium]|nr:hypothetical protein [Patescibacteria group bacterium]
MSWTSEISKYIKSVDQNHLVLDGTYGINPLALKIDEVDIYSNHFYPMNPLLMQLGAQMTSQANKVYFAGILRLHFTPLASCTNYNR